MGQRLRERENEFASNFKYGTVKSAKPNKNHSFPHFILFHKPALSKIF